MSETGTSEKNAYYETKNPVLTTGIEIRKRRVVQSRGQENNHFNSPGGFGVRPTVTNAQAPVSDQSQITTHVSKQMTRAPLPWHDTKNTGKTKHEQHMNTRYERRRNEIAMRENGPSTAAEQVQVKGLENRLTRWKNWYPSGYPLRRITGTGSVLNRFEKGKVSTDHH